MIYIVVSAQGLRGESIISAAAVKRPNHPPAITPLHRQLHMLVSQIGRGYLVWPSAEILWRKQQKEEEGKKVFPVQLGHVVISVRVLYSVSRISTLTGSSARRILTHQSLH